jgi:S-formylglutathione hydrolase FrmB
VIYLLHGWLAPRATGSASATGLGRRLDDRERTIPEVILVSPNGSGLGLLGRSLYLDSFDGVSRIAEYILHDVVEWTDARFRTRRDPRTRGIIGLSDGASAALILAFRHPDVFGACGGHSGQYRPHRVDAAPRARPQARSTRLLNENSPALVAARSRPGYRASRSTSTSGPGTIAGRQPRASSKLDSLGVAHTYNEFAGTHDRPTGGRTARVLIAVTAGMR